MASWIQFTLAVLAIYRIAYMVTREEGPFHLFVRVRDWAGAHDFDETGSPATALGRLFACPLCMGVYISLAVTILLLIHTTWLGNVALIWLGLAGAQAILHRLMEK